MNTSCDPGPDKIHPLMIIKGGQCMIEILHCIYQQCWREGIVLNIWKKDDRLYLQKTDKDSYNSYRSIIDIGIPFIHPI